MLCFVNGPAIFCDLSQNAAGRENFQWMRRGDPTGSKSGYLSKPDTRFLHRPKEVPKIVEKGGGGTSPLGPNVECPLEGEVPL